MLFDLSYMTDKEFVVSIQMNRKLYVYTKNNRLVKKGMRSVAMQAYHVNSAVLHHLHPMTKKQANEEAGNCGDHLDICGDRCLSYPRH